jgi:hypothetical protein
VNHVTFVLSIVAVLGKMSQKAAMIRTHTGIVQRVIGLMSRRPPKMKHVLIRVKITARRMWSRRIQPTTHKGAPVLNELVVKIL